MSLLKAHCYVWWPAAKGQHVPPTQTHQALAHRAHSDGAKRYLQNEVSPKTSALPVEWDVQRKRREGLVFLCGIAQLDGRGCPLTVQFSSIQLLSCVWISVTPWTAAHQASLSITNSQSPLKLMSIGPLVPSNHLIHCRPLLLLPSIFPSIRGFSNESVLPIRRPKYWSFSFSISPSYEYSGLISFRMDWLDLLAVQRTLKSLLEHHSSKASVL